MKTTYLCAHHAERMKVVESEALRCWTEMMRRGIKAYLGCRSEAADIYLGAAVEIGLLRRGAGKNEIFSNIHIIKPSELLIELFCAELRFLDAVALLSSTSGAIDDSGSHPESQLLKWVEAQYAQVECAEKDYLVNKNVGCWTGFRRQLVAIH
jgi:hypothetical protein